MTGFQVGDRVVMTVDHPERNSIILAGDTGTVVELWPGGAIAVEMDKYNSNCLHNCNGFAQRGHGWNFHKPKEQLELLCEAEFQPSDQDLGVLL